MSGSVSVTDGASESEGSFCGRCGREVVRIRFEIGAGLVVFDTFDFVRRAGWCLAAHRKLERSVTCVGVVHLRLGYQVPTISGISKWDV